jgi:hypothetical protein
MHPIYLQHAERRPGCVRGRLGTRPGHLDSACRVSVRPCKMQQSSNSCSFVRRCSICSALPHLARNLCLLDESVCACKRRRYHNVARQPATNRASSSPLPCTLPTPTYPSAVSASIALPSHRKREMDRRPHRTAPHCTARGCHLRGASGNSACRATLRRAVDRSAAPLALGARRCAIPVSAPCLTCQMQRGERGQRHEGDEPARGSHPDAGQHSQVSPWR